MKRFFMALLAFALLLGVAACGAKDDTPPQDIPDLNQYFEDFMDSMGEDAPAMMDMEEGGILETWYPELSSFPTRQSVMKAAAIASVPYEFALVELEKVSDADAVAALFQARIDSQAAGGAFYPATIEAWEKAQVIVNGSVVALICAGDSQSAAVDAFQALFP